MLFFTTTMLHLRVGGGGRRTLSCTPEAAMGGILGEEGLAAKCLLEGEMLELGPDPPVRKRSHCTAWEGARAILELANKTYLHRNVGVQITPTETCIYLHTAQDAEKKSCSSSLAFTRHQNSSDFLCALATNHSLNGHNSSDCTWVDCFTNTEWVVQNRS